MEKNKNLLPYNTFGLPAKAHHFAAVKTLEEVSTIIKSDIQPKRVLGGGSNILFTHDPIGLIIRNEIKGKKIVRQWENKIHVEVGGGENWHEFVRWAVEKDYGGVENLSLIPGTVGAAPVQNIGAYGMELKDVFVRLYATDLDTGAQKVFNRNQCVFGYRDSIFKHWAKGRFIITSVVFSLTTTKHKTNISYGDIKKTLDTMPATRNSLISDISEAVIRIRSSKLPDPAKIGNCGSFFKNPEVPAEVLERIREINPLAPGYPLPGNRVKIPAGWLIEQCGWKGRRHGNTGCYEKQALVLVNHGNATGAEVQQLAHAIIASVRERFEVELEPEVNIW